MSQRPRPSALPSRHAAALLLAALLGLAGCTRPPATAFVAAAQRASAGEPVGADSKGEECIGQPGGSAVPADLPILRSREVFCGGWGQPAARVVSLRGNTDAAQLDALANGGLWRTWLDQRVICQPPQATTLAGGAQARLMSCTRRAGGWPHVALVAAGPDGPVLADGVSTAVPVMEGLATGRPVTVGSGQARSEAVELAVRRLSAEAFGATDVGRYEDLLRFGRDLNLAENFAAAEDAYRAALALHERVLGRDNPDGASAIIHLALNLSNQGRGQEAEALFTRAEALAPRAGDPNVIPLLAQYRGLALFNAGEPARALPLLREAERGYMALTPAGSMGTTEADIAVAVAPTSQTALLGLIEVRRNIAQAMYRTGDGEGAQRMIADSRRLLRSIQLGNRTGSMYARSYRTESRASVSLGEDEQAARQLETAAQRFAIAAPGERPEAVTLFQTGERRNANGRRSDGLAAFRAGANILRARQIGLGIDLVLPYLDALNAEAAADPANAAALRSEMFAAAQLAQRSNTVRFVQQASARLGASGGDPRVAEAVRRLQDSDEALRALFTQRDASGTQPADLDDRIRAAQQARADAESEVAAAAPGYRQLLLSAVDVAAVGRALGANEALVTMLLGRNHGYSMVVRGGAVSVARIGLTEVEARRLVTALRAGVVDREGRPGQFDPAPAQALYDAMLAPLAGALEGAETLVVAPDGPLLAFPFGLLLTGPIDPANPAAAPWLIRRHAIVHVPSPQTFVTLRDAAPGSDQRLPYAGFGDFVPPSPAQLARSFPVDRCASDARLAAGLVRLPGTRIEVQTAQTLTGARPQDIRLGADFTAAALRQEGLGRHRIIHLATHALLPGELSCLAEPSIVLSPAAGAADANSAFVRASELLNLKLDADLVVLSACNTGGPGGAGGGEALSGLARAFFYTGARGLMVTHWAVDDAAAALTVADTIRRQQAGASSAAALRGAQLLILDEAGRRLPAVFAHPFYWAPFALIGDGRRAGPATPAPEAPAPATPAQGAALQPPELPAGVSTAPPTRTVLTTTAQIRPAL